MPSPCLLVGGVVKTRNRPLSYAYDGGAVGVFDGGELAKVVVNVGVFAIPGDAPHLVIGVGIGRKFGGTMPHAVRGDKA